LHLIVYAGISRGVHRGVRECDDPEHPAWAASNDPVLEKEV